MRCAVVDLKSNLITNVIIADPAVDAAPDGMMLAMVPDFVNPGDDWNNGVFIASPVTIESSILSSRLMLAASAEA